MNAPPMPCNEAERLAALHAYDVLDTAPEESFDRITRLASTLLDMPYALVSLVDESRQWFKSRVGLDAESTPRAAAFCAHAICGNEVFVVSDADHDARFRDNPLVTDAPHVKSYAGAPLRSPDGYNLGTLCVADRKPHTFTPEQLRTLEDLAALVMRELELRRAAATDGLTGALTRRRFMDLGEAEFARARRYGRPFSVAILDLDHFKTLNDTYGHEGGDDALMAFAKRCAVMTRAEDAFGRTGGEEFCLMLVETPLEGARIAAERIRADIAEMEVRSEGGTFGLTVSIGIAELDGKDQDFGALLRRADEALYAAKDAGRNRVVAG